LGDAGWNTIFEIYSRLPLRQIPPDATAFGPLKTTFKEYKLPATVIKDVLDFPPRQPLMTELWARVYMPADLNSPPYPLLVFLHGDHNTCGQDQGPEHPRRDRINDYADSGICHPQAPIIVPNHAGYGYLAERLASWGYIVVSINANRGIAGLDAPEVIAPRGRLVLKHLELLSEWNMVGGSGPFLDGVELKDALDFTQVGLLGHSKGGEGVRAAYHFYTYGGDELNLEKPWAEKIRNKITFRGIFEIGPTDGEDQSRVFNPLGVKWTVLLPMCDGDNFELPGVKPFDRMVAVGDSFQKSTFMVWGANHSFYNTEWQDTQELNRLTDCVGAGNIRLFPSQIIGSAQISAGPGQLQRQTALASVMAFFRGNVGRDANPDFNQIFNPEFGLPPVVTTVTRVDRGYTEDSSLAWVFEDFRIPFTGFSTYGLPNDIVDITMEHGIDAIPDHNSVDSRRRKPGRPAGVISWTSPGGFFQTNWALPGLEKDISQFQTLEFRVSRQCRAPGRDEPPCTEPALDLNPTEPTNFSVRFALSDGTLSESVQLAAYAYLGGPVGVRPVGGSPHPGGFTRLHPILQTVRIPLADFRAPLTRVRGVRFTFDGTPTGAIYMSDIRISLGPQR
jgi:hypothetical protein